LTLVETIARLEKYSRKLLPRLNNSIAARIFSSGRKIFISLFYSDDINYKISPPESLKIKLWDIEFRSGLFNAAGMFKNGEAYYLTYKQGAGAYLAGTTTSNERIGNIKNNILHPFVAYPNSGAASNWMGLPNSGNEKVAKAISEFERFKGFPIGISLSLSPQIPFDSAMKELVSGMEMFNKAGVDFIELNESCPNVPHTNSGRYPLLDSNMIDRLSYLSDKFLKKRERNLPVIVKFSCDTSAELLPELLSVIVDLQFDGVNFGNTSTDYNYAKEFISPKDVSLFDYFTTTFGGGVSGKPLKEKSLSLSALAIDFISKMNIKKEFHVIRTGGIFDENDIKVSSSYKILLNQWFTGYFDAFSKYGYHLYEKIYKKI
jgi:dihydroorotate dehydrogenase